MVRFNGKLLRYRTAPQGLSTSALFWPIHLASGFNQLLGEEWKNFAKVYVDDIRCEFSFKGVCIRGPRCDTIEERDSRREYLEEILRGGAPQGTQCLKTYLKNVLDGSTDRGNVHVEFDFLGASGKRICRRNLPG